MLFPVLGILSLWSCASGLELVEYSLRNVSAMDPIAGYEEMQLVAALGGLANRNAPTFFANAYDADDAWRSLLVQPGGWLHTATFSKVATVEALVARLDSVFDGVVLYDTTVTATSLLAETIAGTDRLLPIAYRPGASGSLYERLVAGGPRLPVHTSLVGLFNSTSPKSGSVKRDVYLWMIENLIETGRVRQPTLQGYYISYYWTRVAKAGADDYDAATVLNHDFVISQGGLFWDLSPWDDEAPADDPTQPIGSDYNTLLALLNATSRNDALTHVTGFTPWKYLYVDGKHGGVPTEWQTAKILSAFNAFIDADACCVGNMANAALFQHFQGQPPSTTSRPMRPRSRIVPPVPPTQASLRARGLLTADGTVTSDRLFYFIYMGDYDSAAWVYSQFLSKWNDPARGSVPLAWALDAELSLRIPMAFDLFAKTQTANDTLVSGDSGAGYVNPTQLFEGPARSAYSSLADASQLWIDWNKKWFRLMGMTFTGFVINGAAGPMTPQAEALYSHFSPHGIANQQSPNEKTHMTDSLPVFVETDVPGGDVTKAAQTIANVFVPNAIRFQMFRFILESPSYARASAEHAALLTQSRAVALPPLDLAYLLRVHLNSSNDNFCAYLADDFPQSVARTSESVAFNATVQLRNDGWNTLTPANTIVRVMAVASDARTVESQLTLQSRALESGAVGLATGTVLLPFPLPLSSSATPTTVTVSYGAVSVGSEVPFSVRGVAPVEFVIVVQ